MTNPSLQQLIMGMVDTHGETAQQVKSALALSWQSLLARQGYKFYEQAALLAYLKQGEEAQPYLEAVLGARLACSLYK